jgi:hypothetical protein
MPSTSLPSIRLLQWYGEKHLFKWSSSTLVFEEKGGEIRGSEGGRERGGGGNDEVLVVVVVAATAATAIMI